MIFMAGYGAKKYPTNDAVLREILNLLCVVAAVCWFDVLCWERCLNAISSLWICISFFLPLFVRQSCTVTNALISILRRTCTGDRKLPLILNSHKTITHRRSAFAIQYFRWITILMSIAITASLPGCLLDSLKQFDGVKVREGDIPVYELVTSRDGNLRFPELLGDDNEFDSVIFPTFGNPLNPYVGPLAQIEVFNLLATF